MELAEALTALGVARDDGHAWAAYRAVAASAGGAGAPEDWCVLAAALSRVLAPPTGRPPGGAAGPARQASASPWIIGLSGGQGAGKTTLALALQQALQTTGLSAAICALDDFYLGRARRRTLARRVHPLLATRGVPGTHDVALLGRVLDALGRPGEVSVPVFDKGADDRLPKSQWRHLCAPLDVVVLEGWCVGAAPQPASDLERPVNALEADEDADGRWRRWVDRALAGRYASLWQRIDRLVYLEVPDLAAVRRWRAEQERALPPARRMSDAALTRFVAHYERITVAMQADLPHRADIVVRLADDHTIAALRRNLRDGADV